MNDETRFIVSSRLLGFALGNIDQTAVTRRIEAGEIPPPDAYLAGRRFQSWTLASIRGWNPTIADRIKAMDSEAHPLARRMKYKARVQAA